MGVTQSLRSRVITLRDEEIRERPPRQHWSAPGSRSTVRGRWLMWSASSGRGSLLNATWPGRLNSDSNAASGSALCRMQRIRIDDW